MIGKKGQLGGMTFGTLVSAIVILAVGTVVLVIAWRSLGRGQDNLADNFDAAKDLDRDGVIDGYDPCKGENPPKDEQEGNPNCPGVGKWQDEISEG